MHLKFIELADNLIGSHNHIRGPDVPEIIIPVVSIEGIEVQASVQNASIM